MTKQSEIRQYILDQIKQGRWDVGSKILSENQLMTYFKMSRVVVRLALNELCKEGILESRRGSGTYVKALEKTERKKFILILTSIIAITGETQFCFRYIIEELNQLISKNGYTPITYLGDTNLNIEENLKDTLKDTAGIISIFPTKKDHNKVLNMGIPIVTTLTGESNTTATVITNVKSLFNNINLLIQKYNFQDIMVFALHPRMRNNYNTNLFQYAMEKYYSQYNLISFPISYENSYKIEKFKTAMKNLKKVPDVIIFLDDSIYNSCLPHFPKFDEILSKTKIITHSSGNQDFGDKYKICQVEFKVSKIAEETVKLLLKLINKDFINEYNIYFDVQVKNEDVLK